MAIAIWTEPVSKDRAIVRRAHFKPEKLEAKKLDGSITVEGDLPERPEPVKGKKHQLCINPSTKEMWWEERDRPLTQEEEMAEMKAKLDEINTKLTQLLER